MGRFAFSNEGLLQRMYSAIRVEAARTTRNIRKSMQDSNKRTGRSSRKVILLDRASPRRSALDVGIHRIVNLPPHTKSTV